LTNDDESIVENRRKHGLDRRPIEAAMPAPWARQCDLAPALFVGQGDQLARRSFDETELRILEGIPLDREGNESLAHVNRVQPTLSDQAPQPTCEPGEALPARASAAGPQASNAVSTDEPVGGNRNGHTRVVQGKEVDIGCAHAPR
jgi:hypothetical protein